MPGRKSDQQRSLAMSSDTRKLATSSTHPHPSRKPFSTIQPLGSRTPRERSEGSLTLGMTKPPRLEAKSRTKTDGRRVDQQKVQKVLKFRTSILALDPHAKLFVDGNPLKVIHSKCGGQNTQKAMNDTSNFREHISVCQGPHTFNAGNGSPKSSPQRGSTRSTHPTTSTPPRPGQLPCPGFSFESLFGKDYRSLLSHEREQVTRAAGVAGLIWLNSKDKGSVISMSCLKKSPSNQEPAQPCHNCSKVLELSNFKDTLSRGTPKFGGQRFSPWQQLDPKATGAGHQKTTDRKT